MLFYPRISLFGCYRKAQGGARDRPRQVHVVSGARDRPRVQVAPATVSVDAYGGARDRPRGRVVPATVHVV